MEAPFDLSFVSVDQELADEIQDCIATLERLAMRRKTNLEADDLFSESKMAWNITHFQQAILYRVVMLARGARDTWNAKNLLLSYLSARALVETIAAFDAFEQELSKMLEREDLEAMIPLVVNRMFSTKDKERLQDSPDTLAVNVLTLIDKFEKRYDLPVRWHYDWLSEFCHPNSEGHLMFFSSTDLATHAVTFSELAGAEQGLENISLALGLLFLFEGAMDQLDTSIPKLVRIQRRLYPTKDAV